jgi:restriction system protein
MAIPDYETLMLPFLKYGSEGVISFKDAVSKASDEFQLTDEERAQTIPSGPEPLIKNRAGWAITYLVKANLLKRPKRAYFTTTDKGKEVIASNPDGINRKYLEQFPEIIEFMKKKKVKKSPHVADNEKLGATTPEERIGVAYDEITS